MNTVFMPMALEFGMGQQKLYFPDSEHLSETLICLYKSQYMPTIVALTNDLWNLFTLSENALSESRFRISVSSNKFLF
jgi:hypothetical protein